MGAWLPVGLRIRYPRTRDGDSPEIVPPLGVICLVPFSAVWLTAGLVYSLLSQDPAMHPLSLAIFGCVIPMGIAYGVVTNRRWTRVATVFALGVCAISFWVDWRSVNSVHFVNSASAAYLTVLWLVVAGYLYGSKKARKYYMLIVGLPLPNSLAEVELAPPEWLGTVFSGLSFVAEWLLVVLAFVVFGGLFLGLFDDI